MADTARSEEDKKEYFDSPEELEKKVDQLAALIKKSKHFIAFTVCSFSVCKPENIMLDIVCLVVVFNLASEIYEYYKKT